MTRHAKFVSITGCVLSCACLSILASCGGGGGGDNGGGGGPSTANQPEGAARIKWKAALGRSVYYSSPAISSTGAIYVGNGMPGDRGIPGIGLYALNPDGSVRWTFATAATPFTPTVAAGGSLYVQDETSTLYALDAAGSLRWRATFNALSNVGQTAPAVAADGTVYVGADGVYAFSPAGIQLWRFNDPARPAETVRTSPAIRPDGSIIVGVRSLPRAFVWALTPAGSLLWSRQLQSAGGTPADFAFSSPALAADGTIYIGSESTGDVSTVFALNPDGTIKWSYDVTGGRVIRSSPSIGPDGTIYIATKASETREAELLALRPDGTLRWSYRLARVHSTPDDSYSSPAIAADGSVYFGAETGFVYALDSSGSLLWRVDTRNAVVWSSPAIGSDGTVYIGTNDGNFYAINSSGSPLASSSWPKFRRDSQNSGRR